MFKTLFGAGSPYSYDLQDLACYYVAYDHLMTHWRQRLPGRFIEVDYERVVGAQREATEELLAAMSLRWEPQCLEFHRNPGAGGDGQRIAGARADS